MITTARSRKSPIFCAGPPSEVRPRIGEIAEADAIGDPSLPRDGLMPATASRSKPIGTPAPLWR